jgi:hypothetical protein
VTRGKAPKGRPAVEVEILRQELMEEMWPRGNWEKNQERDTCRRNARDRSGYHDSSVRASPSTSPKLFSKQFGRVDQKNGSCRVPQSPFLSGAPPYGVRRPEPVPVPQGMLQARRTQQKARRSDAGPARQRLGCSTAAYVATVQLPGSGTVALATASPDAPTAGMERGLLGRATAALFDFCAAVHPRSIRRPVRRRFRIFNRPPLIQASSDDELHLAASIRHLQRGQVCWISPLVGQNPDVQQR